MTGRSGVFRAMPAVRLAATQASADPASSPAMIAATGPSEACLHPRARPQVQPLRIARCCGRCPDRGSQVVNGRVSLGGVPVVQHEGVGKRAGLPAGEGAGQACLREARAGKGILVELACTAFVAADEGRAQLGSGCARGQHSVQPGGIHDPAGRNQGDADGGMHRGEQLRRRQGAGGFGPACRRQKRAAVAACTGMLDRQDVCTPLHGEQGLGGVRDGRQDRGARPLERTHFVPLRQPEGKTDELHRVFQQGVHLVLPQIIVIQPQPGEGHPVPPGIRLEAPPVVLQQPNCRSRRVQLYPVGNEDVHAEPGPGGP